MNTMVPIFRAQNLLHIPKKKKERLELNIWVLFFCGGGGVPCKKNTKKRFEIGSF